MWGQQDASFGGGGFLAGATDSPSGGGEKSKSKRSQNIMPATVKELLECKDESLKVEGFEANVVTILGIVQKVETSTTKISMFIDDQTGTMECINYVGTDEGGNSDRTILTEGTYGRIVGALRSRGTLPRYLIIFKATPMTDLNELTMHLLEVVQNAQKLRKLRLAEEAKVAGGGIGTNSMNTFNNSMIAGNLGGPTGTGNGGGSTNGGGLPGFTANQNMVHGIISSVHSEQGMHRDQIIKQIKGRIPQKEILEILEFLSNEGHVFSTVDDDHFSATDSQYV